MTRLVAGDVLTEVRGCVGSITLNRPGALNALTPSMIGQLAGCLSAWRDDPQVCAVAIRGSNKAGPFGAFCAGGDIRLFHQALLAADAAAEDFFTEEYALNHLIQTYPKPYIAFMDGVVMGGGMGLCQGRALASTGGDDAGGVLRLVSARSKLAMPETLIGLFPDVGGGYFLSRCPGRSGEWLALTGAALGAVDAIRFGLADHYLEAEQMPPAWDALGQINPAQADQRRAWLDAFATSAAPAAPTVVDHAQIDHFFALDTVADIVRALEADPADWAQRTAAALRQRSALMLHVALEQVRRGRELCLADDLRMERDMVHHCFAPQHLGRTGAQSETAEGIRALVVDKDNAPRWQPARIEDVTPAMVAPFFVSPWAAENHPLRGLA